MPSLPSCPRLKLKALAILSLYTFVVMLFVSNDSPLASVNNHVDSAIFFMSGKAWANGLIPYVDFSDSKGPLLWFIEMVGYWISPTDYHGVWVLSVIVMTLTFYVCWLTAMQVLCRPRLSLCVAMTMAIPYFLGFSFLETRAETWCNLPVAYGIYLVVRLIMQRRGSVPPCLTVLESVGLGAAVMSCLLIKWSIAAMMMSLCLAVLLLSLKSGKKLVNALIGFVIGTLSIALPFVVYLIVVGAFASFIQEYFMATATTVGVGDASKLVNFYINQIRRIYHSPISIIAILLSLLGSYMLFRRYGSVKWYLPMCYCLFFIIGSYGNHWLYYLQSGLSFALLGIIWIAESLPIVRSESTKKIVYYCFFVGVAVIYLHGLYPIYNREWDNLDIKQIDTIVEYRNKDGYQPTLLCYRTLDVGIGIGAKILPVSKYWFHQNGGTQDMACFQDSIIKTGIADYVYALNTPDTYDAIMDTGMYVRIWEQKPIYGKFAHSVWIRKNDTDFIQNQRK